MLPFHDPSSNKSSNFHYRPVISIIVISINIVVVAITVVGSFYYLA